MPCTLHQDYFDESCSACREEYLEMKGASAPAAGEASRQKHYKELTEERAKRLYEEVMLQYLKAGLPEPEADKKSKAVVRKQCAIRGIEPWPWL